MKPTKGVWLDVPYDEKDEARKLGARWSNVQRRWYVPDGIEAAPLMRRWAPLPSELPGEDLSDITFAFVPEVYGVDTRLSAYFPRQADYQRLRSMILARADHRCAYCGRSPSHLLTFTVLGLWGFDETTMRLRRVLCVCQACNGAAYRYLPPTRCEEYLMDCLDFTLKDTERLRAEVHEREMLIDDPDVLDLSILSGLGLDLATEIIEVPTSDDEHAHLD